MGATLYGEPENEGERAVLSRLATLPDDVEVFAGPRLMGRNGERRPDFVIVRPTWGVIVLEQKDWGHVDEVGPTEALINGEARTSPVEQARNAAHALQEMLEQDPVLSTRAGRAIPVWRYAGVLPRLDKRVVDWLGKTWGRAYLLGPDELRKPNRLERALKRIPAPRGQTQPLTREQVNALRALLNPHAMKPNPYDAETPVIYDPDQLETALEPLPEARLHYLQAAAPDEVSNTALAPNVRLVRGFAGTGKTDVLILRAIYLYERHENLRLLVTTYNRAILQQRLAPELAHLSDRVAVLRFEDLCARVYEGFTGREPTLIDPLRVLSEMDGLAPFAVDFLADEFIWMKETSRITRDVYVFGIREGRGASGTLNEAQKHLVFNLFEAYQERLAVLHALDAADMQSWALTYLTEHDYTPEPLYDVILIDEAQHFAPPWIEVIMRHLSPAGSLFISEDPSQSVYRFFSWRQKGVEVVGRTRWLRVPYRSTRQIFDAAFALIANDPAAQRVSEENTGELPDLNNEALRDGPPPHVAYFENVADEQAYIVEQVEMLVHLGIHPHEIGVLHSNKYVRQRYAAALPDGVCVAEPRGQTGVEFRAVIIPSAHEMNSHDPAVPWLQYRAEQRAMFYMLMTRARTWLFLTYRQKWPKELDPLRPYVDWAE